MRTIAENANDFADLRTADGGNCMDETWVGQTVDHLLDGDFDGFFDGLKSLFAHLPYGEKEGCAHEMNFERTLKILVSPTGVPSGRSASPSTLRRASSSTRRGSAAERQHYDKSCS